MTYLDKLPEDPESERALLSTLCAPGAEKAAAYFAPQMDAADFVDPRHRAVYAALLDVLASRQEITPFSLKAALEARKELGRIGEFSGLIELLSAEEVGKPGVLVGLLRTKRKLRELIRLGARIAQEATEETDPDRIVEAACGALAGMALAGAETGPQLVGDLTGAVLDQIEAEASGTSRFGLRTGFYRFDGLTRGFKPGELIILAARPGIGKSTLALNWLLRASALHDVALFSLEMSREELTRKLLSDLSGLDIRNITREDFPALREAKRELDERPIHIDDRAGTTIRQIRGKVERLQARHDLRMVVVDYLQLVKSPQDSHAAKQSEAVRIGEISRDLKLMAKDCKLPVVVLSQLNREVEKRANGKPQLSDLRDSGCIEQDADMVVFIHRKVSPGLSPALQDKTGELHIAKHRNGPCGTIPLRWHGEISRYEEEERETEGWVEPQPICEEEYV